MQNFTTSFSKRLTAIAVATPIALLATAVALPERNRNNNIATAAEPAVASERSQPSFLLADAAEGRQLITTDSGLQYLDIIEGEGEPPETGQSVRVHYTGTLEKGRIFDSSRTRREPFTFVLGQDSVIKGWEEGIRTMKPGGRRLLIIPAKLGYGRRGAGRAIPPNATLIFDITLLGIN
ncbi:MAG: FKBP-type peptidyl-prolyl cis-trans isomerase [Cyanobacteria bacterium J06641_5]